MQNERATQADIARNLGISRSAVSMALKNHPRISPEMRQQVHDEAERLGYRPDPMLVSLAAYRERRRPVSHHGTLAWLTNSQRGYNWKNIEHFREFFKGAQTQAFRHGYQLDEIDICRKGALHFTKTAAILRARNIQGLVVAPQPTAQTDLTGFPWQDFAAIAIGYTLRTPKLHTVAADQFRAVTECMIQLRNTGHRRIGFVLSTEHVERTHFHYLGAYMALQEMAHLNAQIPSLMGNQPDLEPLRNWVKTYQPDAILGGHYLPRYLRTLGWRVPEDISVVCPNIPTPEEGEISGICETPVAIGGAAVENLTALLYRGERGIPQASQRILVEGKWIEGKTLRSRL